MMTEVSTSPRGCRSGTRARVLVEHAIDVAAETCAVDVRRAVERCRDDFRVHEPASPDRKELADRDAVSRDEEGLSPIETTHDLAAVVAKLSLGDLAGHALTVARVLQAT